MATLRGALAGAAPVPPPEDAVRTLVAQLYVSGTRLETTLAAVIVVIGVLGAFGDVAADADLAQVVEEAA